MRGWIPYVPAGGTVCEHCGAVVPYIDVVKVTFTDDGTVESEEPGIAVFTDDGHAAGCTYWVDEHIDAGRP